MDVSVGSFLDAYCPLDRKAQYVRLDELMTTFGLDDFSNSLIELIENAEMYDKDEVMDRFHMRVIAEAVKLISDHGLTVDEEATLAQLLSIINALELLQVWTDHAEILGIISMDASMEETFCELVRTTTGESADTLMTVIVDIDRNLLRQIENLHHEAKDEQDPVVGSPELVASVVSVKNFMGDKSTYSMRILKSGYPLGAPIKFYMDLMQRHFVQMEHEQIANELFVILHMAEDTYRNVIQGYAEVSHNLFDDLHSISMVDLRIKQLLSQYTVSQQGK